MAKISLLTYFLLVAAGLAHADSGQSDPFTSRVAAPSAGPALDSALPQSRGYPPVELSRTATVERGPIAAPNPLLDQLQLIAVGNNSALLRIAQPGGQAAMPNMPVNQPMTGQMGMAAMVQVQTIESKTITVRDKRPAYVGGHAYYAEISEQGDEVRLYMPPVARKAKDKSPPSLGDPVWVGQLNGPALLRPQVSPIELSPQQQSSAGTGMSQLAESTSSNASATPSSSSTNAVGQPAGQTQFGVIR